MEEIAWKGKPLVGLELPVKETDFAVVDVETTGLGAADRIIEVACVRLHGFEETARFSSLVTPGIAIAPAASAVSGITDEMVARASIFPEISPQLEQLLQDAVLVAHNAPFDLRFLSRERKRWQLQPWKGLVLDTLRLARNTVTLPHYNLEALREALHLTHAPSHRALSDVLATVSLLKVLVDRMDPKPENLGNLLKAQEPIPITWSDAMRAGVPEEIVLPLQRAAMYTEIAELDYESHSGVHTHWVHPLQIEHNGPLQYLSARIIDGGEIRSFRIDRIVRVCTQGDSGNE
ncbi:MAG: WYL domain-containing protein [Candidatus Eisenbacteria sp.]|nr:WYL domain-containing protein [Candidatus Eisenbacteria bacterium]